MREKSIKTSEFLFTYLDLQSAELESVRDSIKKIQPEKPIIREKVL